MNTTLLNQKISLGLLTTLFENTPLLISYLDDQFRYILASRALAQFAHITPEKLIGTTPFDNRPDLEIRLRPILQQVLDSGQPYIEHEVALPNTGPDPADNTEKFWNVNYTPVFDENNVAIGILTILDDVTSQVLQRREQARAAHEADQRTAQLEVQQAELQAAFRIRGATQTALLEIAAAATGVTDLEQLLERIVQIVAQVTGCNRVGISLYKPETEELLPIAVYGLKPEQIAEWRETSVVRRDRNSPYEELFFVQHQAIVVDFEQLQEAARQQGLDLPNPYGVKNSLTLPLVHGNEVVGSLSLDYGGQYHDFTESEIVVLEGMARLTAIAIQNVRLLERVNEAVTLREANRLKDEFMSLVAHELRNPLTTIKGYTQMTQRQLQKAGASQPQLRFLDTVVEQANRMTRLVEDLLDLSRIEAGRFELRLDKCDLAALTIRTIETFQATAPTHHITLELASGPDHSLYVGEYDLERLAQVISNLLSNAIKYSPAGGPIIVHLQRQPVSESAVPYAESDGREFDVIHFSVQDDGIGIPTDQQRDLFERFYRAANSRDSGLPGLGLGLHISNQIVALHGGKMWVESKGENQGSTFHFILPI